MKPEQLFELRVTSPAHRQLNKLRESAAVAIVEFMTGPLVENPHRVGGQLQRELAGLHSARRGVYRIIYEIIETENAVVVHHIDHRRHAYRPK